MKTMLSALVCGLSLTACSVVKPGQDIALERDAAWAVLPFANHSDTPQAGLRAADIAGGLLAHRGVTRLVPGAPAGGDTLLDNENPPLERSLEWAKARGARYVLTGAVHEWRYKVGLDGEPAVGLTLQAIDVGSGQVVWSSVGARSGWSHEALSAVGMKLTQDLLGSLKLR